MGDIRRQRKKFSKPGHPWNKERILAEQELMKEYGLNRKKEIWKMNSMLSNFARQAKELISEKNEQRKTQLLTKLVSLGLLEQGKGVEDVLSIKLKDIMERRLQTVVLRKSLARSIKQARQFIVHEHISIGDKKITIPSYLVRVSEEKQIKYADDSNFLDPDHPEKAVEEKAPKKEDKEKKAAEKKEDDNKKVKKAKEPKKTKKSDDKKEDSKKTEEKKEEKESKKEEK